MLDLDRLEGLMAEATAAPWAPCGANDSACECHLVWASGRDLVVAVARPSGAHDDPETQEVMPPKAQRVANAQLIAELRNSAPSLLRAARESDRLRALLERADELLSDVRGDVQWAEHVTLLDVLLIDIRAALGRDGA
jgi:hypothetical protein